MKILGTLTVCIAFSLSVASALRGWEIGWLGMAVCLALLFGLRKPRKLPSTPSPLKWRYASFIYEKGVRKGIV